MHKCQNLLESSPSTMFKNHLVGMAALRTGSKFSFIVHKLRFLACSALS